MKIGAFFLFVLLSLWAVQGHALNTRAITTRQQSMLGQADSARFEQLYAVARQYYNVNADSGLAYGQKALIVAGQLGNKYLERKAYNILGVLYNSKNDSTNAFAAYRKALILARNLKDLEAQGATLNNLAAIHADYGQNSKAAQYYKQAIAVKKQQGNTLSLGVSYENLSNFYSDIGKYTQALDYVLKAIEVHRAIQNNEKQVLCLNRLGIIYYTLQLYEPAQNALNQALVLAQKNNYLLGQTRIYNNLGNLFNEQNKINQAATYYLNAARLAHQTNNKQGQVSAYNNLGSILIKQERFDSAQGTLQKSIKLAGTMGKSGNTLLAYANSYMAQLAIKTQQPQKALQYARQALTLANQARQQNATVLALQSARLAAAQLNRFALAYSYFEQENKLLLNSFEQDSLVKAGTLAMRLQWQRQQDSVQMVAKEKEMLFAKEQDKKSAQLTNIFIILIALLVLSIVVSKMYFTKNKDNKALQLQQVELKNKNHLLNDYKTEMEQKHQELVEIHEELKAQNHKIEQLNNLLEVKVQERTEKLSQRNSALEKYASYNSHVLRAPITRLIGLTQLLELEQNLNERKKLEQLIFKSSNELEKITKEMQEMLSEEGPTKPHKENRPSGVYIPAKGRP